ncbi:MAG: hypothetical protein PHV48_00010, partial [Candidatus Omnitrophica bacterium]|nr:hypothetical protein [Candidatus Omnitrophota bacterium]
TLIHAAVEYAVKKTAGTKWDTDLADKSHALALETETRLGQALKRILIPYEDLLLKFSDRGKDTAILEELLADPSRDLELEDRINHMNAAVRILPKLKTLTPAKPVIFEDGREALDIHTQKAVDSLINGENAVILFAAGEANRCTNSLVAAGIITEEEAQGPDYKLWNQNLWDIATRYNDRRDKDLTEERIKELGLKTPRQYAIPSYTRNLTLGVRHIKAYLGGIEDEIIRLGGGDRDVQKAKKNLKFVITVNNDIIRDVEKDMIDNHFFGLDPSNVILVLNDLANGFVIKDGKYVLSQDPKHRTNYNHGFNLINGNIPGFSYKYDQSQRKFVPMIEVSGFDYIKGKGAKTAIVHRVNDLILLVGKHAVDIDMLALWQKLRAEKGANCMFEVMNNPNKQKGGLAFTENGFDFLVEGTSIKSTIVEAAMGKLNDKIAKDPGSQLLRGVPYNRLYMYFDIAEIQEALNENDGLMPMSIKHKNGAISPEIPTGDITSMPGVKALSIIRKNDPLIDEEIISPNKDYPTRGVGTGATVHDFKELANLEEALEILAKVDNATVEWYLHNGVSEYGYREREELSEKIGVPVQDMLARFNMSEEVVRFYRDKADPEVKKLIMMLLYSAEKERIDTFVYKAASWVIRELKLPRPNISDTGDMSEAAHMEINHEIALARSEGRGYLLKGDIAGWQKAQDHDMSRVNNIIEHLNAIPVQSRMVNLPQALGEVNLYDILRTANVVLINPSSTAPPQKDHAGVTYESIYIIAPSLDHFTDNELALTLIHAAVEYAVKKTAGTKWDTDLADKSHALALETETRLGQALSNLIPVADSGLLPVPEREYILEQKILGVIEKTRGLSADLPGGLGRVDIHEALRSAGITWAKAKVSAQATDLEILQVILEKIVETEAKKIDPACQIDDFIYGRMSWWLGQLIAEGRLDFDNTVQELWDQRMRRGGVFSYTFDAVMNKKAGEFGVSYVAGRTEYDKASGRKQSLEAGSVIPPPVDPNKNFNKFLETEGPQRRLLDLAINGMHIAIDVNKNPIIGYGFLIIPEPEKEHPQYFTDIALEALIAVKRLSKSGNLKIGFNSWGGSASINHLHLQAGYYNEDAPIQNAQKKTEFNIDGLRAGILTGYPASAVWFEIDSNGEFVKPFLAYLKLVQGENLTHPISILGDYIYIWPQGKWTGESVFRSDRLGSNEFDGLMYVMKQDDFNKIDTEGVEREMRILNVKEGKFGELLESFRGSLQPKNIDIMKLVREACDACDRRHDMDWADVVNAKDQYERIVLRGNATEDHLAAQVNLPVVSRALQVLISGALAANYKKESPHIYVNVNRKDSLAEIEISYNGFKEIDMPKEISDALNKSGASLTIRPKYYNDVTSITLRLPLANKKAIEPRVGLDVNVVATSMLLGFAYKAIFGQKANDIAGHMYAGLFSGIPTSILVAGAVILGIAIIAALVIRLTSLRRAAHPVRAGPDFVVGILRTTPNDREADVRAAFAGMGMTNVIVDRVVSPKNFMPPAGKVGIFISDDVNLKYITLESIKAIELTANYRIILAMTNIDPDTRDRIAKLIKEMLGEVKSIDAADIFKAAQDRMKRDPNFAGKVGELSSLVQTRRDEIRDVYNDMPIPTEAQINGRTFAVATTEKVAMSDICFGENASLATKKGIKNAFIYGDDLKTDKEARNFVVASGYTGNLEEMIFINKNGQTYESIVNYITGLPGIGASAKDVGVRAIEGELNIVATREVPGKLLQIQSIEMNGKPVYATINSYQTLLNMLVAEGELPPGVKESDVKGVFRYMPRTLPIDYEKEIRTYIEAIAVIRTAA